MTCSHLHSVEDNHISSNNNCSGNHIGLLAHDPPAFPLFSISQALKGTNVLHHPLFCTILSAQVTCSLYLIFSSSMVNNCSYIFPSQGVHLSACCFSPINVIQHIIDAQLFGASPNGEKHQYIFLKIHSN